MSVAQLWTKRINIHTLFVNTTVTAVIEICFALLCNVYVIMLKSEVGNILVGECITTLCISHPCHLSKMCIFINLLFHHQVRQHHV